MRNTILVLLMCWLAIGSRSYGQNCPPKGISTDPDNPTNPAGANNPASGEPWLNSNEFDWREEFFDWVEKVNEADKSLHSPFFELGNDNVDYLTEVPELLDYQPEDGWELILYRMGYDYYDPPQSPTRVSESHPSIVLYNRFTGRLRALVYLNRAPLNWDYQNAVVRIRHGNDSRHNGDHQSAALAYADDIVAPLDQFAKHRQFVTTNEIRTDFGYWLVAEAPIAYDPCACNFQSELEVDVQLISSANFSLAGSLSTIQPMVNVENKNGTIADPGMYSFGGISEDNPELAARLYNNSLQFFDELEAIIQNQAVSEAKKKKEKAIQEIKNKIADEGIDAVAGAIPEARVAFGVFLRSSSPFSTASVITLIS